MRKIFTQSILAGLLTAGAATAGTVSVSYQDAADPFGDPRYSRKITMVEDGATQTVLAGMFRLKASGYGNFNAFCVDIIQSITNPGTYDDEVMVPVIDTGIMSNINKLYNTRYSEVLASPDRPTGSDRAAAFQVALWEIIYDDGQSYDLDLGNFSTSGNADVEALAMTYLGGLDATPSGDYNLSFLYSANEQDLVTVAAMPVPASSLMLLGGLGGIAALRRRRKPA